MMIESTPPELPVNALNELKDYLRITLSHEDAKLYSLLRASLDICANFIGASPLLRKTIEEMPVSKDWQYLSKSPVVMIESVMGLTALGDVIALPIQNYAIDINAQSKGRVLVHNGQNHPRIRVSYSAGLSKNWDMLPDQLRSGIIRLAAHIYSNRNLDESAQPPVAIAALWQPYRRMRLL